MAAMLVRAIPDRKKARFCSCSSVIRAALSSLLVCGSYSTFLLARCRLEAVVGKLDLEGGFPSFSAFCLFEKFCQALNAAVSSSDYAFF